jgi:DNA polymerase III subunit gamma/tau
MASESLYRKWRSQTFSDLVGQEPVIRTLKNALNSGKLAHAYLFTGPRGTGKTSTARLLAKTINCLNPQDGEPCNVCDQCREITAGSSFNVSEIDAASNRGIDSIRDLREKVMMPPTTGKYKVYILDEAHMLTTEAFNALLKTLEEPPPHAIFVMATTDVHKMLPTVLSRCQRFDFKRFNLRQLVERLHYVSQQEHVELQNGAAELIARAASGGMRDALSLLDQAIAYAGGVITLEQVQTMLGVADPRAIQKFIAHVAALDSAHGLHLINELSESGADLRQINVQVAEFWRAMMLAKAGATIAEILDNTDEEIREIVQMSQHFTLVELSECARIFAQNELMQKSQATPQLGLELAFLACVELHRRSQDGSGAMVPASPSRPASGPAVQGSSSGPAAQGAPAIVRPQSSSSSSPSSYSPAPVVESPIPPELNVSPEPPPYEPVAEAQDEIDLPASYSIEEIEVDLTTNAYRSVEVTPPEVAAMPPFVADSTIIAASETVSDNADVPTLTLMDVTEKWELIRKRVKTRKDGSKISALLGGYKILGVEGTGQLPIVVCKANADFHYKTLQNDEYYATIRWALEMELDIACDVRLLSPQAQVTIPAILPPPKGQNSLAASPPRPSAHVERPVVREPPPALPSPVSPPSDYRSRPPVVPAAQQPVPEEKAISAPQPLARKESVRENTKATPEQGETRYQSMKQHAENNPVVTEVIRMFKAEINDIRPK